MSWVVHPFFEPQSCTYSYVVADVDSHVCAIIDPVLNYACENAEISTTSADEIIELVDLNGYVPHWILETHIHADHLSAVAYLKDRFPQARSVIGAGIREIDDGSGADAFDHLALDGDRFCMGESWAYAIATPGHTPCCMTFVLGDIAFVGDTLFMPDFGTARCDFPGGNASVLYRSVHRLFALPDDTRLLMCHDYAPNGRPYRYMTTVGEEKRSNVHVGCEMSERDFVTLREARDRTLSAPRLLHPAVEFNACAGRNTAMIEGVGA
jgi:glyoxylase-like metal-dependent hydrolase (beta-lactamase superfamily II)